MDKFWEIKELLPEFEAVTVFDVGANVGQSTEELGAVYPDASIYAFEPVPATFAELRAKFGDRPRVKCFQLALGDAAAKASMIVGDRSVTAKIGAAGQSDGQPVEVIRGDKFCETHGIEHINYLKIDTEGYDLKVCAGFSKMLEENRVDLLQVEAGLSPSNKLHVPLEAFKDYLEPLGYALFRIYDQAGRPLARRCNPVFISVELAYANPNPMRDVQGELRRLAKRVDRCEKANNQTADALGIVKRSVTELHTTLERQGHQLDRIEQLLQRRAVS
jgi:FkbM family methyltransferase